MNLFDSFQIRDISFRNRIAVSPMCEYSSEDGFANDWHLVHLGARAVGGAGTVLTEANAVVPEGRISPSEIPLLYLEHIALAGDHLVQHRIDEEPDEESGDETGNNDDGKGPLRIRSDAGGKGRRQQSQAGDKSCHHNRTETEQRSLTCSGANAHSLLA